MDSGQMEQFHFKHRSRQCLLLSTPTDKACCFEEKKNFVHRCSCCDQLNARSSHPLACKD
ncbi:hypothetical protein T11_13059 [Trichinella zimbabwensis]|uniref:Uncharacterized protein n=1 Tax=Trichinella zimbabwensis TaxID=268475 RepID=A0A0V1GZP2_9BILA|nr:hypothetical protein T11_13059 [Trichinella zimbabwensis]